MNSILLFASSAAALGAVLLLVHWVMRECGLPIVARLTLRQLQVTRDQALPDAPPSTSRRVGPAVLHKADEAVRRLFHGCPCSEVILATYGPALGISRGEAFEFCRKYAQEMNLPRTCAAVTGACIALGMRCARAEAATPQHCSAVTATLHEFAARFCARDGSVACRQMGAGDSPSGPTGANADQRQWVPQICPKLVHDAAEILEQMLN